MSERRSILLVCDTSRRHAANVTQHVEALTRLSRHDVETFDPVARPEAVERIDFDHFDVVVVHYTIVVTLDTYLPPELAARIAAFDGLKVQFIQDEYRTIDAVTARMRELGIGLLFTLVPEGEVSKVYGERVPGVTAVTTLAGYVPDELVGLRVPPLGARPIDVGYRGRSIPYWLGRLGQDKVEIGRGFLARATHYGLRCDIAWGESDRIYGERWNHFLTSCRATLGTESGASIADFDGSLQRRVTAYMSEHPAASFDEVEQDVLAPHEGNVVINVISPRMFEAAALRTAMVLFPGEYSQVIERDRHYITLARDFSNMDEVAARLRDLPELERMVARAYDDLVASRRYSLAAFVREFDDLVAAHSARRARPAGAAERRRRRLPALPSRRALLGRAHRVASMVAAARLVAEEPAARRLLRAYASDPESRGAIRASRIWEDVVRVAALLGAKRGKRLLAEGGFDVVPRYDPSSRRLAFASRPRGVAAGTQADGDCAREALADGAVEEIVWNHAAVSDGIVAPIVRRTGAWLPVGFHVVPSAHSFGALVALGRRHPELVRRSLEPLLRSPEHD